MNPLYSELASNILDDPRFRQDYKCLFRAFISQLTGDPSDEPDRTVALRLTKTAQILVVSSVTENVELGIRIISMLLEIAPSYLDDVLIIAETIFSRLGNFPNISLINERWNTRPRLSASLNHMLSDEMHRTINNIESLGISATDFQIDLWNDLQDKKDIVTIAPTSTGKSHIIMQYIVESMIREESNKNYALYVVPSRALISEVSGKVQKTLPEKGVTDVEVATVAQRDKEYDKKTIFVLTQERLLMLLHFQRILRFAYIVVDEAQNIAEGNRAVLLHIVLTEALSRGPVQLIFSTPSNDYDSTFDFLLGEDDFVRCKTDRSPVAKNYIYVKCVGKRMVLRLASPEIEIDIPKGFSGSAYHQIVRRLGEKSVNIVFCSKKRECESIVRKLLDETSATKGELDDASDYIRRTVHEDYSLAEAIRKEIVFHYGPLPRNIRTMIERCVEDRLIDYVVCTTTLAEGVNMPAQNLFIYDPKTFSNGTTAMSFVQLNNVIGRAGRLMKHFSGNVFFVDYDKWEFPESIKESPTKQKLPTYYRLLKENTKDIIYAFEGKPIKSPIDRQTLNATLNKLVQDRDDNVINTMLMQYVDKKYHAEVLRAIESLTDRIKIPRAILNLNPTVGIVQQDNLYKHIYDLDSEDRASLRPISPYDSNFPNYLKRLVLLLQDFDLLPSGQFKNDAHRHKYVGMLCIITENWVKGNPLRDIIQDYISAKNRRAQRAVMSADRAVKDIVSLIDEDISFRLSNAIKCYCDIYTLVADQKSEDLQDISEFYAFIEIGASDKTVIALISIGLTRQTAIEVYRLMGKEIDVQGADMIGQITGNKRYHDLHRITRQEIDRLSV